MAAIAPKALENGDVASETSQEQRSTSKLPATPQGKKVKGGILPKSPTIKFNRTDIDFFASLPSGMIKV